MKKKISRKLKITIEGKAAVGKTALGIIITKLLSSAGMEVVYGENQHETKNISTYINNIDDIIEKMNQDGVEVLIEEKQSGCNDPF